MNIPNDLLVTEFHDRRNRLDYYHPRIPDDVRTPVTEFFSISPDSGDAAVLAEFDEQAVAYWMREQGFQQAFVRSVFSSAKVNPIRGSHISRPEGDEIRDTVANLIAQHITTRRETGGTIAVREWLDLDYCPRQNPNHFHPTEVRYFVQDGDILYRTPELEEFVDQNVDCDDTYAYVREDMIDGVSYPDEQAQRVAEAFTGVSWHVDFVREAKSGEWYCTDMGLNGLYWDGDNEEWVEISEHTRDEYSPEQYSDELPEPVTIDV